MVRLVNRCHSLAAQLDLDRFHHLHQVLDRGLDRGLEQRVYRPSLAEMS